MLYLKLPQLKKVISLFFMLAIVSISKAQVGIGTTTPKTTLQIEGEPTTTSTADGVRAPMLTLAQLNAKISAYGSDQDGVIVYINDVSTAPVTQTANINATGYYYYDAPNEVWNAMKKNTYSVGDFIHGGVVFAVDDSGQHGLVCAIENQSLGIQWTPENSFFTMSRADGIYAGKSNTTIIISVTTARSESIVDGINDSYAALICANYISSGFSDWYLPSNLELQLMYFNRNLINEVATDNGGEIFDTNRRYWSSTEIIEGNKVLGRMFTNFTFSEELSKTSEMNVRAIRAF